MRELATPLELALLSVPDEVAELGGVVGLGLGQVGLGQVVRELALVAVGAGLALLDGLADDALKLDVGLVAHAHLYRPGHVARGDLVVLVGSGLDDGAQDGVGVIVEVRLDGGHLLKPVQLALQDRQALKLLPGLLTKQLQADGVRDFLVILLPELVFRVVIILIEGPPIEAGLADVGIVVDVAEGVLILVVE